MGGAPLLGALRCPVPWQNAAKERSPQQALALDPNACSI
jgi:hypothetical protein